MPASEYEGSVADSRKLEPKIPADATGPMMGLLFTKKPLELSTL
jgi:hypothetical protein